MNLAHNISVSRVMTAQAAGATAVNGSVVDMQGWDGVLFIALFGAIVSTAVTGLKAQQGAASDASDAADLLGTLVSIPDTGDDKALVLDIYRPQERYVRPVVNRATANATIDGVIAIRYKGRKAPASLDATVVAAEMHQSPAEGTA